MGPALRSVRPAAAGSSDGGTVRVGGTAVTTTQIEIEHDPDRIAVEWEELAGRTAAVPFVRPGWITAWFDAFGDGPLHVVTLRREGRLAGVVPCYGDRRWLRSPTNEQTPQFGVVAEDETAARELAAALLEGTGRRLTLGFLDASGWDLAALRDRAEAQGYLVLVRPVARPPYLVLEGDWQAFEGRLAARLRRDLRRRRRRLQDDGSLTVEVADGATSLEERLEEGFQVETSGWKAAQQTAILSRPETLRFFTRVAQWAAANGWLRLAFLRLDGRPLAFQLGLEEGGAYYFLKGGYDAAFHRYAPGKLLLQDMLERAFSSGLERFEFLGQPEPWKLEWTHHVRLLVDVDAFEPSLRGRAEWAARSLRHRLTGVAKRATKRAQAL
jgi:CelD/BcsL family acetyltransferase involved in cellulose biosynthesis